MHKIQYTEDTIVHIVNAKKPIEKVYHASVLTNKWINKFREWRVLTDNIYVQSSVMTVHVYWKMNPIHEKIPLLLAHINTALAPLLLFILVKIFELVQININKQT